ncbi:unnamed protein product, partial [Ceratitis capitata]
MVIIFPLVESADIKLYWPNPFGLLRKGLNLTHSSIGSYALMTGPMMIGVVRHSNIGRSSGKTSTYRPVARSVYG